jgi:hypothetical protein
LAHHGPLAPSHRQAISKALQGHKVSDSTKQAISKSLQGHKVSDSTKQAISKTKKEQAAKKRQEKALGAKGSTIDSLMQPAKAAKRE